MAANVDWLARLKAVECRDATASLGDPSLVMSRASGCHVFDAEGRPFIDLCAGFGVLALGHASSVQRRVFSQYATGIAPPIVHGMGDVYATDSKVALIEDLLRLLPRSFTKAALALTGSQAVEIAVKTSMLATGRAGFITFQGGYHGLDLGILPLTSRSDFRAPFEKFLPVGRVATLPFQADSQSLERAVDELAKVGGIAAVIVEPIQGRAGVRSAGVPWLKELRDFCDRHGALLIYDEVFTGLGRTGRLTFAAEVPCDLLCLGKALGGGLPLSACVGTERAMDAWPESQGEALHTGTFFGHPMSCAMASETLRELVALELPARAARLGGTFKKRLTELLGHHPAVKSIRGEGLMLALELRKPGDGVLLMNSLRARGVIALVSGENGDCLSFTPPLVIEESLLNEALAKVVECLNEPAFRPR